LEIYQGLYLIISYLAKLTLPIKEILNYIDVLVDGQYVDELHDFRLEYRGSSNQRVIDVQKSLLNKEVVSFI
jgi:organic radical activating enzyme